MKAGPSQVNFAETNPSKFGVCSSRTMQGSFSQALRTARRCGCDLRIDFLHLSQSGGRLINFKNLNLHATLYHAVNVGERHLIFAKLFVPLPDLASGRVWFVPCLLAVCLLLKRFFSSLVRFAGSSATHTQRKNIC